MREGKKMIIELDREAENENKIEWVEVELKRGTQRRIRARCLRVSQKILNDSLNNVQKDAAREIERAYNNISRGWGYALLGIQRQDLLRTRGGQFNEDLIDNIRDNIGRLHAWEFECKPDWRNAVKAIHEHHLTARTYGERIEKSPTTILDWYRRGLDEYCKLQGWKENI